VGLGVNQLLFWILFNVFVLGMLGLDLWVFRRPAHAANFRKALFWSVLWIALAAAFAVVLYFWQGHDSAVEFTTGYIIEFFLSVDNLFIFLLIFRYFRVPAEHQHRVLFWGILGALVMRGLFILVGIQLIQAFHWITYLFGVFLVYSGLKMFRSGDAAVVLDKNPVLRLLRRWVPITENFEGGKFFVRRAGLYATPLLVVLLVLETTDLLFATDSIPAVLAITLKPFIVYTSNVFAILGLRAMYFVLAGLMEAFQYLHYGLSIILIFVGAKMLAADFYRIPTEIALAIVVGVLAVSILASGVHQQKQPS
jgi:tellurite resistance protein TerC